MRFIRTLFPEFDTLICAFFFAPSAQKFKELVGVAHSFLADYGLSETILQFALYRAGHRTILLFLAYPRNEQENYALDNIYYHIHRRQISYIDMPSGFLDHSSIWQNRAYVLAVMDSEETKSFTVISTVNDELVFD